MYLLIKCRYSIIILHTYSISWESLLNSGSCYIWQFLSHCLIYGSYTPYGGTGATFHWDSRQVTSDQNHYPLCNERKKSERNGRTVNPFRLCFFYLSKIKQHIPSAINSDVIYLYIFFYKYFFFSSSYKNSKNKIYISIGSVHKIPLICHGCTWRWGRVFLTVRVISREALTAHKERVHGGHFGSDKRMYTVEDGC